MAESRYLAALAGAIVLLQPLRQQRPVHTAAGPRDEQLLSALDGPVIIDLPGS